MIYKNILLIITFLISIRLSANDISDNYSMLLVDADNGNIMMEYNAEKLRYPASLTKVMTMYLIFDEIKKGTIKETTMTKVSDYAESQIPSKIGLKAGELISVKDLILSLIIKSANDSAVTAAELISGSEEKFVTLMNRKARAIGMRNTVFVNASGIHDDEQVTTSYDMAILVMRIIKEFPKYYGLFSQTSFKYKSVIFNGHNYITENYDWATGLKTGFTNAAGHNLITTASKEGKNILGIITGEISAKNRDISMLYMLKKGFIMSGIDKDVKIIKIKPRSLKLKPIKRIAELAS